MVLSKGDSTGSRIGGLSASLESCAVPRRALIGAAALLGVVALAGCGSQGVASPTPQTCVGPCQVTAPVVPAFHLKGDPKKGSSVFASQGCGGCHTLKAANATGTIGPNLDTLKPDYQATTAQVTNGGGVMPAFKTKISTQEIADVSAYVVDSTGGKAP